MAVLKASRLAKRVGLARGAGRLFEGVELSVAASEVVAALAGLRLAAATAVTWVSRESARESIVQGLAR